MNTFKGLEAIAASINILKTAKYHFPHIFTTNPKRGISLSG